MAVIYLKHEVHGAKVACSDLEAAEDRKNGWVDYDPAAPKAEEPPPAPVEPVVTPTTSPVVPSFLSGGPVTPSVDEPVVSDLPENFPGREYLIEAGIVKWESVVDMSREDFIAVKGIGPKTADEILKVLNS